MDESKKLNLTFRGIFAVIWIILLVPYLFNPKHFSFLDYANLPFHEAGHYVFFAWFGEFTMVLGGTIAQLMIPLGFSLYFFFKKKDVFAGFIALSWFFQNFFSISLYMKDARFLLLPLFGGDPIDAHDWNYLFGKMKLLHESVQIGEMVRNIGVIGLLVSIGGIIFSFFSIKKDNLSDANLNTENKSDVS